MRSEIYWGALFWSLFAGLLCVLGFAISKNQNLEFELEAHNGDMGGRAKVKIDGEERSIFEKNKGILNRRLLERVR